MGEPKAEKPIPFSSPMVRAQRAGLKTQTRRCPKLRELQPSSTPGYDWTFRDRHMRWHDVSHTRLLELAPYQVGDLLWVREPLRPVDGRVHYDADGQPVRAHGEPWPWKARYIASRYCPRWASRTTLKVLSVRVERVQSITEEDARAEGVTLSSVCSYVGRCNSAACPAHNARPAFRELWDSINGKRPGCSWAANPYVWVVGFGPAEVRS